MDPKEAESAVTPVIRRGRCHVLLAFDIGTAIDLDQCDRLITEVKQRDTLRHKRRAPTYFDYRPLPLRITQQGPTFDVMGFCTEAMIDVVLYDFGGVSVAYHIPLSGPLPGLLKLSEELYDNPRLLADSRHRIEELLHTIRPTVARPEISDFVEDYLVFEIPELEPAFSGSELIAAMRQPIGQILRSERQTLSEQEIDDATSCRLSYGPQDVTVIDWNATFVYDREPDDILAVLEFANVQLLEMRFLDQQLDDALDEAYVLLSRRRPVLASLFAHRTAALDRVAQLQVDNAVLYEGVNNVLKLLGDQYLARAYMAASRRFHLSDWDSSIQRKIETLDSIYDKLTGREANFRAEFLEWIIIILIAAEIVMAFLPGHK